MEAIYTQDFNCREDVEREFEVKLGSDINILFASYTYENYEGNAEVLFEQNGTYFEVSGGHCSCYGLEGQWIPCMTTLETIKFRLDNGGYKYTLATQSRNQLVTLIEQLIQRDKE